MINVYTDEDLLKAKKQKNSLRNKLLISLAIVFVVNVAIFIFYLFQEFETKYRTPLIVTNIVICSVYAAIALCVYEIKYKRVSNYYKLMVGIQTGLKTTGTNAFVRFDSSITVKDGVDCISMVVLQWSEKKQEYFERHVLCDLEKPLPSLNKGDVINYVTHANVLVSYELSSPDIFG